MSETPPPLSRLLAVSAVPPDGVEVEVAPDGAERLALAEFNDVVSVDAFVARLVVKPFGRDGLAVEGALEATATRICGVSLEPFPESVSELISVSFTPDARPDAEPAGDEDPPEPLVGGAVDLGAIASEFFTLALDPYPRKPGAAFAHEAEEGDERLSPFAALKGLGKEGGRPN